MFHTRERQEQAPNMDCNRDGLLHIKKEKETAAAVH